MYLHHVSLKGLTDLPCEERIRKNTVDHFGAMPARHSFQLELQSKNGSMRQDASPEQGRRARYATGHSSHRRNLVGPGSWGRSCPSLMASAAHS
jgi:hypothetical protein